MTADPLDMSQATQAPDPRADAFCDWLHHSSPVLSGVLTAHLLAHTALEQAFVAGYLAGEQAARVPRETSVPITVLGWSDREARFRRAANKSAWLDEPGAVGQE